MDHGKLYHNTNYTYDHHDPDSRMKEIIPLFLLESGEGKIEGTTRFQKLVFLAQNEPDLALSEDYQYHYYAYKYGPFSKELAEDLDGMQAEGLIKSKKVQTPGGARNVYRLTDGGREVLEECKSDLESHFDESLLAGDLAEEALQEIANVEEVFNNMPLSNLLEYVYNHYESFTTESELDIA